MQNNNQERPFRIERGGAYMKYTGFIKIKIKQIPDLYVGELGMRIKIDIQSNYEK